MQKLWDAAAEGRVRLVKEALRKGANAQFRAGDYGDTPLTIAAYNGHLAVVVELLKHPDTDVDATDAFGTTAIGEAAEAGHLGIVEELILAGADVNQSRNSGVTPTFIASEKGHSAIVGALLEAGGDPKTADNLGDTPLHVASVTLGAPSEQIVLYLLDSGAEINAQGSDRATPLMWAVEFGNFGTTKLLLERGADVTIRDINGELALDQICVCKEAAGLLGYLQCPAGGCDDLGTTKKIKEALLKAESLTD